MYAECLILQQKTERMKKLIALIFFLFVGFNAEAQIKTAAPSPFCKIEQKVGLTDVTIEYSRPSMKDRTIFGDLVPYDEMWRTGANKNTMFTFSDDVTIDGKELKAGTYAIFVEPRQRNWSVNFYTDTENWGTPEKWDTEKVALTTLAQTRAMPMPIETFTIDIGDLRNESATISFLWENTWVDLKLGLNTNSVTEKSIEKTMAGPSWRDHYSAGRYFLENTDNSEKALKHLTKAATGDGAEKFWVVRQLALAQAKAGKVTR